MSFHKYYYGNSIIWRAQSPLRLGVGTYYKNMCHFMLVAICLGVKSKTPYVGMINNYDANTG